MDWYWPVKRAAVRWLRHDSASFPSVAFMTTYILGVRISQSLAEHYYATRTVDRALPLPRSIECRLRVAPRDDALLRFS